LAESAARFGHDTSIRMTHEELTAKAVEHARRTGIAVELLHSPKVREAVIVTFTSQHSSGKAKFYLDARTGDMIGGEFSGPEFTPKATGKQFSKRAQRVLALASEESRRMGCEHVGSEHLLLGVLVSGEGSGAAALAGARLSVAAVRGRITAVGSASEDAPNGYGPSMRNILRLSSHHADSLGHPEIEPEHFVLGLLDEAAGPAMRTLQHFRVDVERVRTALRKKMSDTSP
jgi:ATP-dependent Clp protease ATP-binding subunit ClpC